MIGAIAGFGMGVAAAGQSTEERVDGGDAGRSSGSRSSEARPGQTRVSRRDRTGRAAATKPDGASSPAANGSARGDPRAAAPRSSAPTPADEPAIPPFPSLPPGAAQVEQLTAEGATLLPADGSREVMVYRWQLPPDVKEGDVVVDGRVDERATELLRQWIHDALEEIEKHGHPLPLPFPTLTGR